MQNVNEVNTEDAKDDEIDVLVVIVDKLEPSMGSVDFRFVANGPSIIQKIYLV